MVDKHIKHSNIVRPSCGNYARNEVALLGTTCEAIGKIFAQIQGTFPNYQFGVLEADHKAEENTDYSLKITDKINFIRTNQKAELNAFKMKFATDNLDLLLVNGNHFEANKQILVLDSRKDLTKKLGKITDVAFILKNDLEVPHFLVEHFKEHLPPIYNLENTEIWLPVFEEKFLKNVPILNGLLLAGGKSTRMGTDKTKLKYHGDLSQMEYASQLLQSVCNGQVFVSSNDEFIDNELVIKDSFLNMGPLGGILSAMMKNPNAAWLVLAADMPYVTENTLQQLVLARNPKKIATCFKNGFDGFPEPLIAIYEPKVYPIMLQMLALGYDCPRKTLINFDSHGIDIEDDSFLQNVNTPEQHKQAMIDLSPRIA